MDPSILELCLCSRLGECECQQTELAEKILSVNALDTAIALSEVMNLCGILPMKAQQAIPILFSVIHKYDEEVFRIDMPPKKHLRRNDLFLKLGTEGGFNRFESQMIYSIVKRAFRALYFCTGKNGVYNPKLEARCKHGIECMWTYAAKKTAEAYSRYEDCSKLEEKTLERKIKCIYKNLFDVLQKRYEENEHGIKCMCKKEFKIMGKSKRKMKCCKKTYCQVERNANRAENCSCRQFFCKCLPNKPSSNQPKCDCEKLECSCNTELQQDNRKNSREYIGPYQCRWVPYIEETRVIFMPSSSTVCTSSSDDVEECVCECVCESDYPSCDVSSLNAEEGSYEDLLESLLLPESKDFELRDIPSFKEVAKRVLNFRILAEELETLIGKIRDKNKSQFVDLTDRKKDRSQKSEFLKRPSAKSSIGTSRLMRPSAKIVGSEEINELEKEKNLKSENRKIEIKLKAEKELNKEEAQIEQKSTSTDDTHKKSISRKSRKSRKSRQSRESRDSYCAEKPTANETKLSPKLCKESDTLDYPSFRKYLT